MAKRHADACNPADLYHRVAIMVKELVPIVLACTVWAPQLAQKTVLVQCDNTGVVAAVQKWTSKDQSAMHLQRCLWFFTAYYDIVVNLEHIPGEIVEQTTCLEIVCKPSSFLSHRPVYSHHPSLPS